MLSQQHQSGGLHEHRFSKVLFQNVLIHLRARMFLTENFQIQIKNPIGTSFCRLPFSHHQHHHQIHQQVMKI